MRIAVISIIREGWGGSEELWAIMAENALKEGHKVWHSYYSVIPQSSKKKKLTGMGLICMPRTGIVKPGLTTLVRWWKKFWMYLAMIRRNPYQDLFDINPDIVFYVGTAYSIAEDRFLIKCLKHSQASLVINVQLNNERVIRMPVSQLNRLRVYYEIASKILFVSERNRKLAIEQTGLSLQNSYIVRNPVNLKDTNILPFPYDESPRFFMVGFLRIVHKGQDIALKVLGSDKWKQRKWTLDIYGEGEDKIIMEKMADQLGIAERILFHGKVNDIGSAWLNGHLLLMPSRMEGIPLAVVEAMICGRPCVLTDVGGHKEWVSDGIEGWIAECPEDKAFDRALEKAWTRRHEWASIGKVAHKRAMSLYDPEPGKTLLKLFQNRI